MKRQDRSGFTLIEMLVALSLTLVVSLGLAQLYKTGTSLMLATKRSLNEINTVRSTIIQVGQDVEGLVVNAGAYPANVMDYEVSTTNAYPLIKTIYPLTTVASTHPDRWLRTWRLNMRLGHDYIGFYSSPDGQHINKVIFYVEEESGDNYLMYRKVFDYRLGVGEGDYHGYAEDADATFTAAAGAHGEGLYDIFPHPNTHGDAAQFGKYEQTIWGGWKGVQVVKNATLSFRYMYTQRDGSGNLEVTSTSGATNWPEDVGTAIQTYGTDCFGSARRVDIEWLTPPLAVVMRLQYSGVDGPKSFVRTFYIPQSKWPQMLDQLSPHPR